MKKLYPSEYMESTYDIDYEKLYSKGFRGILFDIDNTLVMHGAPADDRALKLFKRLKEIGFATTLLSNNKLERVSLFNEKIKVNAIHKANKPSTVNIIRAMKDMNTNVTNTVFIGDQIFTDVFAGNRAGIKTILVKPINPKEEIQIVLKRWLEKIVLLGYGRYIKKKQRREKNESKRKN
ncbi:MAG: superfamily [Clostridiales bacterium]|jgi:HAD superfamily phosphatase (TIGR01668 family)|nr:superfamily [Clostridiales bacterium]